MSKALRSRIQWRNWEKESEASTCEATNHPAAARHPARVSWLHICSWKCGEGRTRVSTRHTKSSRRANDICRLARHFRLPDQHTCASDGVARAVRGSSCSRSFVTAPLRRPGAPPDRRQEAFQATPYHCHTTHSSRLFERLAHSSPK